MLQTDEMTRIEGGTFSMGSSNFYPEEAPVRVVEVQTFFIDPHTVTNAEFSRFVRKTGYVTVAERPLDPKEFPQVSAAELVPGSLCFHMTEGPVDLNDFRNWWSWVQGACWKRPEGPGSSIASRPDHPVVHVAYEDVESYARWAGKRLPTEAEWEYASRGGLDGKSFVWGDDPYPDGRQFANTWQGDFPWKNSVVDGYERTAPVGQFPANGYGLFDMAGNVWEWTSDWYVPHGDAVKAPCCAGDDRAASFDPCHTEGLMPRKVLKGGSFLCAPNYCLRFRPGARSPQAVDTGMSHIGFRCVADS
jgi:formylglycine-generating enzyme